MSICYINIYKKLLVIRMNMKIVFKELLKIITVLIISAFIGYALLVIAYSLPYLRIKRNIANTSFSFNMEGLYPEFAQGYYSSILDNVTDSLMLGTAAAETNNPFLDAVNASFEGAASQEIDRGTVGAMMDYVNGVNVEYEMVPYPRYWHGYLIVLKPLLIIMTYSDVRMMNIAIQIIVIALYLGLLTMRFGNKYFFPSVAVLIILNPVVLGLSFQNSSCFYCSFIPMIILLYAEKRGLVIGDSFKEYLGGWLRFFFLLTGILTVYFDLLTYPVVTMGLPLVLILLLLKNEYSFKDNLFEFKRLLIYSSYWSMGYLFMWLEKWIIASIVLKKNIIADAFSQILYRSGIEDDVTHLQCFIHVLKVLNKPPYILLLLSIAVLLLILLYKNRKTINKIAVSMIPFVFISLYPFIWWSLTVNHCMLHSKFVYRDIIVSVFSICAGIIKSTIEDSPIEQR